MSKILTTKNNKILIDTNKKIYTIEKIGATIKSGGGTPVPNSGYVENIYFNTSLSVEEVISILDTLNFVPFNETENIWACFADSTMANGISITQEINTDGTSYYIKITQNGSVSYAWSSVSFAYNELIINLGWQEGFNGVVEFNMENQLSVVAPLLNFTPENDKASNLFSTTPFGQAEEIELSGEYDGSTIEVTDLSGGWQGTVVPNSGYVENVYFNTELSVEEVVSLLEKLNYNADLMSSSGIDTYGLIGNPNVNVLMVATLNGNYAIMANSNVLFSSAIVEGMTTFVGWNENFNGVFEYNGEALPTINNAMGEENDKLTNLFSTTPFTRTEENTINIKNYIDNKQIPLSIKVNVDTGAGGGGSEDYPSESIAYYKQTRNKDYPYFPLPYEMEEETQDTIYMLYDANGYMCCPAFNIRFTNCVCTIQKYNNTKLVSESNVTLTSGSTTYLQFSEEDSDYSTYNYIVIKLQGNITQHYLNETAKFNNVSYQRGSSELIEVSGKCASCDIKVMNSTTSSMVINRLLEYYSFTGVISTSANNLLWGCDRLNVIPQLELTNTTSAKGIVKDCKNLKAVSIDIRNVTNASEMFSNCFVLDKIHLLNTNKITNASSMFSYCNSLKSLPQIDLTSCTTVNNAFRNCHSLTSVPRIDVGNVTDMGYCIAYDYLLSKIGFYNIKVSFDISTLLMLSQSELVNILNNLATVETTQTLTLGSKLLAKLTDEEKAIATEKNWTLA